MNPFKNKVTDPKLRKLSFTIGLIFFYFGILKFFPSYSPAEDLGISTIEVLFSGFFSPKVSIVLLALLEVGIGVCLMVNLFVRTIVILTIGHLILTFTPLMIFPEQTFSGSFATPSLLGQYIFKNIIIIAALFAIYPKTDNEYTMSFMSKLLQKSKNQIL